jgi:hypothetical protein
MNIIGYVFLIISVFVYIGIVYFLFSKESTQSGTGSAFLRIMIFSHLAFFIGMGIVAGIIAGKGGFTWVAPPRFLLIGGGLLLSVVGSCLWALFKIDDEPGMALQRLGGRIFPVLIPLLLLWGGAILLNDQWRSNVGAASFQWPLKWAAILGALGVVVFAISLVAQERRNARAKE